MSLSRRDARVLVMQSLYAWELASVSVDSLLSLTWLDDEEYPGPKVDKNSSDLDFMRLLLVGTLNHVEEIDKIIEEHLENWEITRLNLVDKQIIRFSTYSLLYQKDIPVSVVIDEAIGIAKDYGTDDSFKFVNAVLDSIHSQYGEACP